VGASGDLAPLSHIAQVVMGEGEVITGDGGRESGTEALARAGVAPVHFAPKEGLSFINGTQAQTAMLSLLVHDARVLWRTALASAAMSLEALRGTPTPFDQRIHEARPHHGQRLAAEHLRALLDDSEIRASHLDNDPRVQDAYSLRCLPQVMGAVCEAIDFAERVCRIELNSSTDNPLVFDNGDVLSGGNFHGQPVAQALDFLAIAITTLQAMTERRVERLVNPDLSHGLPAFLIENPGLRSGYMMVQITAAALVAESRTLTSPASVGSIPTDANQEDFVPMGMGAAFKATRVLRNAQHVVATELLCAVQGIELLKPLSPGRGVRWLEGRIRHPEGPSIMPLTDDRPPAPDLERLARAVATVELDPREFLQSG
jgi:histidine ammonia-lyase